MITLKRLNLSVQVPAINTLVNRGRWRKRRRVRRERTKKVKYIGLLPDVFMQPIFPKRFFRLT